MKNQKKWIMLAIIAAILSSCSMIQTRVETDVYTITERDTTYSNLVQNAPENRDNGVIYPSSRVFLNERNVLQRDSIVPREYPDFIRLGLFETVGLMGTSSDHGLGVGMFGIFPDFTNLTDTNTGKKGALFSGGIYRIGIGEFRLRWFRDAKNWTIGTSIIEVLVPSAVTEHTLFSYLPLYLRKRYYLREEIPYIAVTPFAGFGWYPSQYVNIGVSIDVGSIGGLNIRAYAGFAVGINMANSPQIINSSKTKSAQSTSMPYVGIGFSFLDFLNRIPETEKEWKYHEHSSWDIGFMQIGVIKSGAKKSAFLSDKDKSGAKPFFDGLILRLAHAEVALPILNNQFYVGTALANFLILGNREWGMGVMPLRIGYWQTVIADELSTEPFLELNYYPSSFINIGNRLNLRLAEKFNIGILLGYASGSASKNFGSNLTHDYGIPGDFSRFYFGVSFGAWDRIFFPEELRYKQR